MSPASSPAFASVLPLRAHPARALERRQRAPRAEFAQSGSLLRGLNVDHVRELAVLITCFGKASYTLDALTSVRATQLDERGLALEAVMCDGEGCVCTLETLRWPGGSVHNATEALSVRPARARAQQRDLTCNTQALRCMVERAGLDGSVLGGLEAHTSPR